MSWFEKVKEIEGCIGRGVSDNVKVWAAGLTFVLSMGGVADAKAQTLHDDQGNQYKIENGQLIKINSANTTDQRTNTNAFANRTQNTPSNNQQQVRRSTVTPRTNSSAVRSNNGGGTVRGTDEVDFQTRRQQKLEREKMRWEQATREAEARRERMRPIEEAEEARNRVNQTLRQTKLDMRKARDEVYAWGATVRGWFGR